MLNTGGLNIKLCNWGLVLKLDDLKKILNHDYFNFLKKLTIKTEQKVGPPKIAHSYKFVSCNNTKYICLPRTLINSFINFDLATVIDNKLSLGSRTLDGRVDFVGNLFPNQSLICDWLCQNIFTKEKISKGDAGCIIDLMAGLGKTFVAGGVIEKLKLRTLYIVPRIHLQQQAINDLTPILDCSVIGSSADISEDISVVVINSALKFSDDVFNSYGLVIFDEIHMYCGQVFRNIFFKAQTSCVLGMTATSHHRLDNFDSLYYKLVGPVVSAKDLPNYDPDIDRFKGEVKVILFTGPVKTFYNDKTDKPDTQKTIGQFIDDDNRNKLIVREAKLLYNDPNSFTYIFVEHRRHVLKLFELISNELGIDAVSDISSLMGNASDNDRLLATKSRIIVTTYCYSGTGISYVRMNSAIFATPRRSNYEQICRRVTRKGSDTNIIRKYVDIVDTSCFLKYQYYSRKKVYDYFNYDIHKSSINSKDL